MSRKQRHYAIKHYHDELFRLQKNKENFELITTSYTKRIVTNDCVYFFNDEGKDDVKQLLLISAVRNDAKKFLEKNSVAKMNIKKTDFFNVLDIIDSEKVYKKIDIRSAYWIYAMKLGVVTEDTNNKFIEWYKNVDYDYAKNARLKALGSLATTKFHKIYVKGRYSYSKPVAHEPTKDLYMEICNGIDRLMKDVNFNVEGCTYYYWDCMFIEDKFEQDAIDYFKKRGYDISVEETKLEFLTIGGVGYLLALRDGKMYMTKRENKYLLMEEDELTIE